MRTTLSSNIFSIIFSFWTSTLDVVATALDQINLSYTRIDGTMPVKQRQQALKFFKEDSHVQVILMSLRCGSTGYATFSIVEVFGCCFMMLALAWNDGIVGKPLTYCSYF